MKTRLTPHKPFLMMLYGYPGCGKTYFSKQFANEFTTAVALNADKLAHGLNLRPNNDAYLVKIIDYLVVNYLESGISVILDMPVMRSNTRKKYRSIATKNNAQPVLLWMQIDPDSAFIRTKFRAKNDKSKIYNDYSKSEFQTIGTQMQNPTNEEFYVLSGKHTYKTQSGTAMNILAKLRVVSLEEANKNVPKPELVNLVPKNISGRGDFRRNISIR